MSSAHKGSKLILKDALIPVEFSSAHFDFNNDAIGIQYGSLIEPNSASVYTLRPNEGKFGTGVAVEEGTTNEINYIAVDGSGNKTTPPPVAPPYNDTYGVFWVGNSDWSGIGFRPSNRTISSGNVYSVSAYAYVPTAGTASFNLQIDSAQSANEARGNKAINASSAGWYRLKWENLSHTTDRTDVAFRLENNTKASWTGGNNSCWLSCVQFERKAFSTSFLNGARSNGRILYPSSIVNKASGAVSCWINSSIEDVNWRRIISFVGSATVNGQTDINFDISTTNKLRIKASSSNSISSSGSVGTAGVWYHVACSWGASGLKVYIDGKLDGSLPSYTGGITATEDYISIGHRQTDGGAMLNGMISDMAIFYNQITDEDIEAIYVSQRPLYNPYDYRSYAY